MTVFISASTAAAITAAAAVVAVVVFAVGGSDGGVSLSFHIIAHFNMAESSKHDYEFQRIHMPPHAHLITCVRFWRT